LKSTETRHRSINAASGRHFSNFGSLKSTETVQDGKGDGDGDFSNFGSLKSTETRRTKTSSVR